MIENTNVEHCNKEIYQRESVLDCLIEMVYCCVQLGDWSGEFKSLTEKMITKYKIDLTFDEIYSIGHERYYVQPEPRSPEQDFNTLKEIVDALSD